MEDNQTKKEDSFYSDAVIAMEYLLQHLELAKGLEEDRDVKIELIKAYSYIDEAKDILKGVKSHYENKS